MATRIKSRRDQGKGEDSGESAGSEVLEDDAEVMVDIDAARRFRDDHEGFYRFDSDGKRIAISDDESVTVVNVSLAKVTFAAPDDAYKGEKDTLKDVRLNPGGVYTLPARYAVRALGTRARALRNGVALLGPLRLQPPKGDCKGKESFTVREERRKHFSRPTFGTCPYAECPTCGPKPWSVFQAHRFIMSLGTEDAVDNFVQRLDPRPTVVAIGWERKNQILERRADAMNLVVGRPSRRKTRVH